ncbi:hypothetical protein [Roseateles noduli]|uniref:hypothetical protein n=1 Tax=Roseateles noduli TaxID=2052484 RepID=UPI003D662BAF
MNWTTDVEALDGLRGAALTAAALLVVLLTTLVQTALYAVERGNFGVEGQVTSQRYRLIEKMDFSLSKLVKSQELMEAAEAGHGQRRSAALAAEALEVSSIEALQQDVVLPADLDVREFKSLVKRGESVKEKTAVFARQLADASSKTQPSELTTGVRREQLAYMQALLVERAKQVRRLGAAEIRENTRARTLQDRLVLAGLALGALGLMLVRTLGQTLARVAVSTYGIRHED